MLPLLPIAGIVFLLVLLRSLIRRLVLKERQIESLDDAQTTHHLRGWR